MRRIHASCRRNFDWKSVDWRKAQRKVKELQMRIAKAVRDKKFRRAKSLQWLLTHSFYAKVLAVRRVVTNKGRRTPGVDGVIWKTPKQKMHAVNSLNRRGYRPLPLRRVYTPKKSGKLRPLGIPTMRDRAMQALYALALAPVAETTADPNSYGFREYRCCADAIAQCFNCLARSASAKWVLEADIQACFDRIAHHWMLDNILMDKKVLKAWLEAGYIDRGVLYPTKAGTPQGGIASPVLANMTLDGLESAIKRRVPQTAKVHVIRYADDFIVTGDSKELLQEKVIPAIRHFLQQRGLNLFEEKTKITPIEDGFDFLGQNLRKYGDKLIITPSKSSVKAITAKIREITKAHLGQTAFKMIQRLTAAIRGWANYHRHGCSKRIFAYVDNCIFNTLRRWLRRRHPDKRVEWVRKRYFRSVGSRNEVFFASQTPQSGACRSLDLLYANTIRIVRHVKIKGEANPYDRDWQQYFAKRKASKYVWPALA